MYQIPCLSKAHNRDAFDCGNDSLNKYLKEFALKDIIRKVSVSYVIAPEEDEKTISGYYSLSQSVIQLYDLPEQFKKKLPKYQTIPATLLGRLAVDCSFQKKGLGSFLLINALKRSLSISSQVASYAIIVDAIDDDAINFYKKFNFIRLSENSEKRLFLPMTLVQNICFVID